MLRSMTHRQLSEAVGWKSHTMVGQLLRGERSSVAADSAVMISQVLGIAVHDLFLTESSNNTRQASGKKRVAA